MTRDEIITLRNLIEASDTPAYNVVQQRLDGTTMSNFHEWANEKNYEGAFLISNQYDERYWFVLIEWKPQRYYLVLFPDDRSGPLLEIHQLETDDKSNQYLEWTYKPTKRDGKNADRVEYFKKFYFDSAVTISFPSDENELPDFYDEIFSLLDTRVKSDVLDETEPEFRDSFPEGKRVERIHKTRERNPRVIKIAKREFKIKHGKLFCEACCFDFEETYGKLGEDFIEGHHALPLSQILDDHVKTRVEDIIMLCSNCHKMIHRKRPWLTVDEISKLLT